VGTTGFLRADVKVPSIFGDHMILQQDAPLPVWGLADPGEKVTVTVGSDTATATAGADGKWSVKLSPLDSTSKPLTMTIAGKNTLTINDVLVGEVWLASGQSNMGFPLGGTINATNDLAQANDPQLRFFHVNNQAGLQPSDKLAVGGWSLTTPDTAKGDSAVAYFFAKELRAKFNRPVAIIQSAVGGTCAEAWTPLEFLKKDPALQYAVDKYNTVLAAFPQANADYPAQFAAWHTASLQWQKDVGTTYMPLLKAWQDEANKDRAAGQPVPPQPQPSSPQPKPPAQPWGGQNTPTVLYNALIAPVIPYAIKGAIWYQGEANAGNAPVYHTLLSNMITGWREHWGQGDFPFLIVQLPKWHAGGGWPVVREAEAQTAKSLTNVAFATVIDVGDANDLHPKNKLPVGQRLALVARHLAYGEKNLVWTGPIYDSMKVEGNSIRVSFTHTGGGLIIGSSPWVPPHSEPIPTTSLVGFAVAGEDKNWVAADAKIDGDTVVVSSDKVPKPIAVRYAWQNSPDSNLYNKEGLTAAPFRTDDWPDLGESPRPPAPMRAPAPAPAATTSTNPLPPKQ
jgi:sialate O-acetylesterase